MKIGDTVVRVNGDPFPSGSFEAEILRVDDPYDLYLVTSILWTGWCPGFTIKSANSLPIPKTPVSGKATAASKGQGTVIGRIPTKAGQNVFANIKPGPITVAPPSEDRVVSISEKNPYQDAAEAEGWNIKYYPGFKWPYTFEKDGNGGKYSPKAISRESAWKMLCEKYEIHVYLGLSPIKLKP